jgi:hypothetical protein
MSNAGERPERRPAIAMDLGSCREVIDDGQTGFLTNNVTDL